MLLLLLQPKYVVLWLFFRAALSVQLTSFPFVFSAALSVQLLGQHQQNAGRGDPVRAGSSPEDLVDLGGGCCDGSLCHRIEHWRQPGACISSS